MTDNPQCPPKLNCSSSGQSEELVTQVSTDSTYNASLRNVAEGQNPCHSAQSTPYSKDCAVKATSIPETVAPLAVVQNDSTTTSPMMVQPSSNTPTASFESCSNGTQTKLDRHNASLSHALAQSPIVKFVSYPLLFPLLDRDDKNKFIEQIIKRYELWESGQYKKWYMCCVFDVIVLADLFYGYVRDKLEIVITIHLKK
jgi:hypothetical protein